VIGGIKKISPAHAVVGVGLKGNGGKKADEMSADDKSKLDHFYQNI
jgi:hypothetical protein